MSACVFDSTRPASLDALLAGRLSRRALCALGAASALALAGGCAAPDGGEPAGPIDEPIPTVAVHDWRPANPEPLTPESAEAVKLSMFAFNTLVSVTVYGVGREDVEACMARCAEFEGLFSARVEGSDVACINASAGDPVEVDSRTAALLEAALAYSEASGGLFDVTVGTVSLLWDFELGVKPAHEEIEEALRHVGYENLQVKGTTVTLLDPATRIDLGGIAKGWLAARLLDDLVAAGATGALVSLGSSSTCLFGTKPGGALWRVGLRDPLGEVGSYNAVIELTNASVTSSGLYDRRFELDGQLYWHILDPATGYPAQTDMLGDTVLCDDPTLGDALSTALFVMGVQDAAAWVEKTYPQVAAMFVNDDNEPVFANGFVESSAYTPVAG